jgi:hypothetical protein
VVSGMAIPIYMSHLWRWLLLWCAGALARRLTVFLLRQVLPDSGDGVVGTVAHLRLAPVCGHFRKKKVSTYSGVGE